MKSGGQSFSSLGTVHYRSADTDLQRGPFCIRPLTTSDSSETLEFLRQFEYRCTGLASLFVPRSHPEEPFRFSLPSDNSSFVLEYNAGASSVFAGLLHYSASGLLYHCLPFNEDMSTRDTGDLKSVCSVFFTKYCAAVPLSSIMGTSQAGLFLEKSASKPLVEARECRLMSLSAYKPPSFSVNPSDSKEAEILKRYKLCRCTLSDSGRLFDLMMAYYIEEVLPAGMLVSDKDVRLLLNLRLKKHLVFAMENENGVFEAMAATTALGIQSARIGGVYTLPESRRQGLASVLVKHISTELLKLRYTPVLFVRTANPGAEKLYANCGFSVCGSYRIAYF